MEQKFYICKHCGNIIAKVKDVGVPVVCCGERIDPWAVEAMAYYGITRVRVLKETSDKREENFR